LFGISCCILGLWGSLLEEEGEGRDMDITEGREGMAIVEVMVGMEGMEGMVITGAMG